MLLRSLFVGTWLCLFAACQTPTAEGSGAAAVRPKLHIVGASVSGGFRDGPLTGAREPGDSVTLHHLLQAWCGEQAAPTTHPPMHMLAMFAQPEENGKRQIQGAAKVQPDAVIAVDFPFWYAYGYFDGAGEAEQSARSARYERGLQALASLKCTVLVGDLPDMAGAAARMLRPAQIPSPAMLQALNEQLVQFVRTHPQLRIVPLAKVVAEMKGQGVVLPLASGPVRTPPGALLQGDKLHANRLGMAYLGLQLQPFLQRLFPTGHALRSQTWTFEQFVAACGAESDLEAVLATTKGAANPGTSPAREKPDGGR
jgi:hypothetical protein